MSCEFSLSAYHLGPIIGNSQGNRLQGRLDKGLGLADSFLGAVLVNPIGPGSPETVRHNFPR